MIDTCIDFENSVIPDQDPHFFRSACNYMFILTGILQVKWMGIGDVTECSIINMYPTLSIMRISM